MTSTAVPPPDHVRAGFGVPSAEPERLSAPVQDSQVRSWRLGDLVLRRVDDPGRAAWVASTLEQVQVQGLRLSRPVRSSDGRWVLSGWSASRFVAGSPAARPHDIIIAGEALHRALVDVPEPRVLRNRTDPLGWADRLAWGELTAAERALYPVGEGEIGRRVADLESGRDAVALPAQLVHARLSRGVLFAGDAPPAAVDFRPLWRPAVWASALVVVDSIIADGAPTEVLGLGERYGHWRELVRRALLFRLASVVSGPDPAPADLIPLLVAVDRIAPALA